MNLASPIQLTPSATMTVIAADGTNPLQEGTLGVTRDGRQFRWVQAGASNLVVGNMLQAAAEIANHQDCSVAAAAIGATSLTVTPGATAGAANLYANGLAVISVTPGLGYAYNIDHHAAITASVAFTLYLAPDDPIQVALTTSSKVTLIRNAYKGVIQAPVTTLTGPVVGAAVSVIPASGWGWIQTRGLAGVLIAGTPGPGVAVVSPGSAAGAVVVDGAAAATQVVGSMGITGVDGKVGPVFLNLP
jgi:hypothetical protein